MRVCPYALAAIVSSIVISSSTSTAEAQASGLYRFSFVPEQSGLTATLSASVSTSGTLLGNYDAKSNPTGTRTKPGLFGSFGSTENLPVAVQDLSVAAEGPIDTQTSGTFDVEINPKLGIVSATGLSIDALSGGSISIPFSLALLTEAFRTRNPTFTYPAIPLEIPIGSVAVNQLSFVQNGPGLGTITPIDGVSFDVSLTVPVSLELTATLLGQVVELTDGPVLPLALSGVVVFDGDVATFTASTPLQFDQTQTPAEPLPPFDLPLPTTNPDVDANVVASLILDEIGVSLLGQIASTAEGVRVVPPCPADLDGDGAVGGGDLALFLGEWGPCLAGCAADFNADGVVNGEDFGTLLSEWGACG
jgi:hypothetical protein